MKVFVALFLCALTPAILANHLYGSEGRCRCVDPGSCSDKFSTLIEPRSPKYQCPGNQVCCKPEHIINADHYDTNAYASERYNHIEPYHDDRICGKRTKISAYKRLVLPAAFAGLGEFPWQAAILKKRKNYTKGFVFVSSGVLVGDSCILTTAHSVLKLKPKNVLVRLGENNVQADPRKKYHHVNARVKSIVIKENFNADTLENDLALVCLEKKVKFNAVVNTICLPDFSKPPLDLKNCLVSGWGKGSHHGNYSTALRKASLSFVPHDKCQYLLRNRISDPTFVLDKSFVCAGGDYGKDACTGDAGGPLSCPAYDGRQVLTGLVSWGIGCGEKNVPGVYSLIRSPATVDWIIKQIHKCKKLTGYNSNYAANENYAANNNYVANDNYAVNPTNYNQATYPAGQIVENYPVNANYASGQIVENYPVNANYPAHAGHHVHNQNYNSEHAYNSLGNNPNYVETIL